MGMDFDPDQTPAPTLPRLEHTDRPTTNGAAAATVPSYLPPPPPPATGTMPRRYRWLRVPEEYGEAGMQALVYINYPSHLEAEVNSGDPERIYPALQQIIVQHNEWRDEEGQPLPAANTRAFWEAISTELAVTLLKMLNLESKKLPSSLT